MGTTIHYNITTTRDISKAAAHKLLVRMRDIALTVFGSSVGDIIEHSAWAHPKLLTLPWRRRSGGGVSIGPNHIEQFDVSVGAGCETLVIGLYHYPKTVKVQYRVYDDDAVRDASGALLWSKWVQYWRKRGYKSNSPHFNTREGSETRTVRTNFGGWSFYEFCKTLPLSATSDPQPFIAAHARIINYLLVLDSIPDLDVVVYDESGYGSWRDELAIDGHFSLPRLFEYVTGVSWSLLGATQNEQPVRQRQLAALNESEYVKG